MNRFAILFLLVPLTWFMCPSLLLAKDGKIKYGKHVVFVGNIEDKKPSGQGVLHLIDPQNKKADYCVITGYFNDTIITDAIITSSHSTSIFSDVKLSGNSVLQFKGDRKKCQSLEVVFGHASLSPRTSSGIRVTGKSLKEIIVSKMALSFQQDEAGWTMEVTDNNKPQSFNLDDAVAQKLAGIKNYFIGKYLSRDALVEIGLLKSSQKGLPDCYDFDVYAYFQIEGRSINALPLVFYIAKDGTVVFMNTVRNNKKGYTYTLNNDDWEGNVVLNDGTNVKKASGAAEYEVKLPDGSAYNGTLNRAATSLLDVRTKVSQSDFLTGEYTKDGTTERWFNGESFSARHQRISFLFDEDLVESIEKGEISEKQAVTEQERREEALREERTQTILQTLFGSNESVVFSCSGDTGKPRPGGDILGAMGMESGKDIVYDITLQLNKDMTGSMSYYSKASQEASYNNTIHYTNAGGRVRHAAYVQDLCDRLNRVMSKTDKEFTINGDTIKLDGEKFVFSDDLQTVQYYALELVTLKQTSGITSAQAARKVPFPKSLVGRTYKGVIHLGEYDRCIETTMTVYFKNANTIVAHSSMKPMNDDGLKLLAEMLSPGITEKTTTFKYVYSNGVARIPESGETFKLQDNNEVLYWYANDEMNGYMRLVK